MYILQIRAAKHWLNELLNQFWITLRNNLMIKRFGYIKIVLLACVLFQGCAKKLPKVLIIGDSISGGYFPFVEEQLEAK